MRRDLKHPTRIVPIGFAALIAVGTLLLALPVSSRSGTTTDPLTALFTASSAGCVTGLTVVDTGTHWSGFGQVVILALCQVGGFGIMAFATLLGMLVARRGFGFQSRLATQAETHIIGLSDVPSVIRKVLLVTTTIEALAMMVLTLRFHLAYDYAWPKALWHGLFHAVSAFNNAGISLYSNSIMGFASDPWICVTLALAVLIGSLGFPVMLELRRRYRTPAAWSIHTKLTVGGSVVLLAAAFAVTAVAGHEHIGVSVVDAADIALIDMIGSRIQKGLGRAVFGNRGTRIDDLVQGDQQVTAGLAAGGCVIALQIGRQGGEPVSVAHAGGLAIEDGTLLSRATHGLELLSAGAAGRQHGDGCEGSGEE